MPFVSHTPNGESPLAVLALADPGIAQSISNAMLHHKVDVDGALVRRLVDDIMHGLSLDASLGQKIADGYLTLFSVDVKSSALARYSDEIRQASEAGVTLSKIVAIGLAPVLAYGDDDLLATFLQATSLMKAKWFSAMSEEPMEIITDLITPDDVSAGRAWLAFLRDLFTQDLTYNQYRRFAGRLPKAVMAFPASHRAWRLEQMRRVVQHDFNLACVFTESLGNQLALLSENELSAFVSEGLGRYQQDKEQGRLFLSLASASGRDQCARLQTVAVFPQVQTRLICYLQARCGRGINVKKMSSLSETLVENHALSAFDGQTIYLADVVDRYPERAANEYLYKTLAWVEAGLYEFGTFDFDFEKAVGLCNSNSRTIIGINSKHAVRNSGNLVGVDMERFFQLFSNPFQAAELFSIFEYGRIRSLTETVYPGGATRFYGYLRGEAEKCLTGPYENGYAAVYALIALGCQLSHIFPSGNVPASIDRTMQLFNKHTAGNPRPEVSGVGVYKVLAADIDTVWLTEGLPGRRQFPFQFQLRPDLYARAFGKYDRYAEDLKQRIMQNGARVYKSDIMKRLRQQGGVLYKTDIVEITKATEQTGMDKNKRDSVGHLSEMDLSDLEYRIREHAAEPAGTSDRTCRYKEWDNYLGDYLPDHVLVREHDNAAADTRFYQLTLSRNPGLVRKIRYAFELLKPEAISRLRHWPEGDEFDYRQLLNFALDKKSGRTPSDRIYIKRLKSQRDVAVSLLIDFSRSTANVALGEDTTTVMDIQKEAAVLFCEALAVVGDAFALAGFSGTGRLGVDYFLIKDFEQRMTEEVRRRIGAIRPRRNTRMGAAIRHAAKGLDSVSARSKLLIIISDGFPNDVDYKRDYALADTRRALLEVRARQMAVHAITVNISEQAMLDQLYGKVSHSVISNVRQLPDKLLRIYGRLTG